MAGLDLASGTNYTRVDLLVRSVGLQTGDKENSFLGQFFKPTLVVVARAEDNDGALGQL